MSRLTMLVALAILALPRAGSALAASTIPSRSAESGSPIADQGASYHFRTYITSITPKVSGLTVEVLEFADRLLLRNHTGKTVTIYGYSGEPYARVQADGATEQNTRSPAVYLNTNFYAQVTVPPSASASAPPVWQAIDHTGEFEWHDHRIHWMSPVTPPQVKDTSKRTKIFSWSVPIRVGGQPGAIAGELFWVPENSKASTPVIAVFAVLIAAALASIPLVRRRRRRRALTGGGPPAGTGAAGGTAASGDREAEEQREAW